MNFSNLINDFEIFIITYNRIEYLKKALHSAINQSVTGLKITVLDNGSVDGTSVYLNEILPNNPNINYVKEPVNINPLDIFFKAVSLASKKYVLIFHDDDILHPQYAESALKIIQKHNNIDIIYTKFNNFDDEKNISVEKYDSISYKLYKKQDFIRHIYINKGSEHLVYPCVIYKTHNLKNMQMTDDIKSAGTIADMDIVIETLTDGNCVFIENKLYNYRNHKNQESHVKKLYPGEIIANNLYFKEKLNCDLLSRMSYIVFSYYWFRNLYKYFGCYENITLEYLLELGYKEKAITQYTYLMGKKYGKFLIPINYIFKKILQIEQYKRQKISLGGINQ